MGHHLFTLQQNELDGYIHDNKCNYGPWKRCCSCCHKEHLFRYIATPQKHWCYSKVASKLKQIHHASGGTSPTSVTIRVKAWVWERGITVWTWLLRGGDKPEISVIHPITNPILLNKLGFERGGIGVLTWVLRGGDKLEILAERGGILITLTPPCTRMFASKRKTSLQDLCLLLDIH